MIRVEFQTNEGDVVTTGFSDPSGGLIDVCDACRSPVIFSCRSASCGTCRVEVLEGQALLLPPADDELETLSVFDAPSSHRLACRARFRSLDGVVKIRWAGDDP